MGGDILNGKLRIVQNKKRAESDSEYDDDDNNEEQIPEVAGRVSERKAEDMNQSCTIPRTMPSRSTLTERYLRVRILK